MITVVEVGGSRCTICVARKKKSPSVNEEGKSHLSISPSNQIRTGGGTLVGNTNFRRTQSLARCQVLFGTGSLVLGDNGGAMEGQH